MDNKIKENCSHPNCRMSATKKHPRENKGLCDLHYIEVSQIIKGRYNFITLTEEIRNYEK